MKRILGVMILTLLGVLAIANVASASWVFWYQPKAPKTLTNR